jgi:glycosyltransferase involved in cell wall biosynthesis
MPRVGKNPMKWINDIHQSERVTVTTIVYIPQLEGYWEQSLDVLKLCFQSLHTNTHVPFDLMVFDNGSCKEVRKYLLSLYKDEIIDFLTLSRHNLGKVGAWNMIFLSAPGKFISYFDSDVYFLPGWLEASLKVMEAFPEVGMVTAQPIAGYDLSKRRTAKMAKATPSVRIKEGKLIPEQFVRSHIHGLGGTEETYQERQIQRNDVLISKDGVEAYTTASHFQFTTRREIVKSIFPDTPDVPLGKDTQFRDKMLDLGYWMLTTTDYLVHHMGNRVPDLEQELPWLEPDGFLQASERLKLQPAPQRLIISNHVLRSLLRWVNVKSYQLLYLSKG